MHHIRKMHSRITLNGGPASWRAVLPNEKHEFSAGWRAEPEVGPDPVTGVDSGRTLRLSFGPVSGPRVKNL